MSCKEVEQMSSAMAVDASPVSGDSLPIQRDKTAKRGTFAGMSPALYKVTMKKFLANSSAIVAALLVSSAALAAGGGAEGGTNLNAKTGELVEFERMGKVVRIDPKEFEGLYKEVTPALESLEARIPGLRAHLESAMEKPWFITTKQFEPRNKDELRPIGQDEFGVFFSVDAFKAMNRQQRIQAFFHELVRGFVMKSYPHDRYPHAPLSTQDYWVEYLTPRLFDGADRPAKEVAGDVNGMILSATNYRKKYVTRKELTSWIEKSGALTRFERICEQELKGKTDRTLFDAEEEQLLAALKSVDPQYDIYPLEVANFTAQENITLNFLAKLGLIRKRGFRGQDYGLDRELTIQHAQTICKEAKDIAPVLRKIVQPVEEKRLPGVNSIEDALRVLEGTKRDPSSSGAPVYVSNASVKGPMESAEAGMKSTTLRSGSSAAAAR